MKRFSGHDWLVLEQLVWALVGNHTKVRLVFVGERQHTSDKYIKADAMFSRSQTLTKQCLK